MSRVAALAVTQTIGYGTLYYSFAVLLRPVAADLHAGTGAVTGAFTLSVVTGAVLAIPVGRLLDRHGGRALMTAGSLVGALALVAYSGVDRLWQLYAVQAGIGAASAAGLYEAAFAVVLTWYTAERRAGALLTITVVAGFASTIFLPLTGRLVDAYGWRTAVLVLAAIQALTVPLHAVFVRRPGRPVGARTRGPVVWTALADRGFWLLALAFAAHTAAVSTLTVHLVSALVSWGHPPAWAAAVAGLLGVLSVAGRLVTTGLQRRFRTTSVTAAVFAVQAVAALAMPVVAAGTAGAVGTVTGVGIGFGVATIARPVLLAERYGTGRYATLAGILVVPMTLAKAVAPLAAAALPGYTAVLAGVAACCGVASAALIAAGRVVPPVAERCHA
ncbi:MFS transporter [Couchioplanes caeruleus]|uniref:MFS transporter n=1 Tax=Couchioplanes caeruleus TaxID=56438 RepID=UPI00201BBCBB|nr:MFS transporter [Couchioplanes caeruleus]UQU61287.1 MFS transporter [Couchioplanes caeruleus]